MNPPIDDNFDVDVEALNKKYAEERAKRLRPDALHQYRDLKGTEFDKDPHADPNFTRPAIVENTDVLIIGGGFAGMLAGARLREVGLKNLRIVEKGADFGGTWYWNRYPGAACDVESYVYMPLLEELGYVPTEKYAKAPEIYAHCQRLAKRYDLYRAALFQTAVEKLIWNDGTARWLVSTSRGDRIEARFVISCTGLLSNAKLPGIPGIESFAGHSFHTSRWDYEYTGGDERHPMVRLADKRVGIIGTGSTGIQVVPEVAKAAKHLYVFQRTPASVDVRNNRPTDPKFFESLAPGWQRRRRNNFTALTSGEHEPEDLVGDAWTEIIRSVGAVAGGDAEKPDPLALQRAQMRKMELTRRRVASIVRDPATAEALKPYYHYFCKRPCFHDEFLQAFNRTNVTLVDTQGKGVERITPQGVVVAGKEYPLDLLIYATGFDFMTEYSRESGVEVIGPGGQPLDQHWSTGARTLYGLQTHGFPNFFLMSLIQSGVSVNYVHIADEQTKHIAYIINECIKRGIATVQPTQEAENEWVQEVLSSGEPRRQFLETCTPSVFNQEGKRERSLELNDLYARGPMVYIKTLEDWRSAGELRGLELKTGSAVKAG
jgi:cation diffusion facilitator CzcD-associated flavoprotein CzcO